MSVTLHQRMFTAGLLPVFLLSQAMAQEKICRAPLPPISVTASNRLERGYRLQDADDLAFPLRPVVPKSAAVETRNEALAWYMTGRLLSSSSRNEHKKALNAFRKAVALDPQAIEIYRNLVPLEFAFENIETALRYAVKAIQLDPDDYDILLQLARQEAVTGKLPSNT